MVFVDPVGGSGGDCFRPLLNWGLSVGPLLSSSEWKVALQVPDLP
jgi:hypothetical protein